MEMTSNPVLKSRMYNLLTGCQVICVIKYFVQYIRSLIPVLSSASFFFFFKFLFGSS